MSALKKPGSKGFRGSVVFQKEKEEQERARKIVEAENERKISDTNLLFKKDSEEEETDDDGLADLSAIHSRKAKEAARHRASILA